MCVFVIDIVIEVTFVIHFICEPKFRVNTKYKIQYIEIQNIKIQNTKVWVKIVFGWNHVGKAHSYIWFGAENTDLTDMKFVVLPSFQSRHRIIIILIIIWFRAAHTELTVMK